MLTTEQEELLMDNLVNSWDDDVVQMAVEAVKDNIIDNEGVKELIATVAMKNMARRTSAMVASLLIVGVVSYEEAPLLVQMLYIGARGKLTQSKMVDFSVEDTAPQAKPVDLFSLPPFPGVDLP